MKQINLVTSNMGKVKEFRLVLEPQIKINHINMKYDEIQSQDATEIAGKSAKLVSNLLRKVVVVEDSGLFIDALNGFPGTFSSDIHKQIGLSGILKLMKEVRNRSCEYRSVVGYCRPKGKPVCFAGIERGTIALEARGKNGFGHDPIFIPEGSKKTYGEIEGCERLKKFRKYAVSKLRDFLIRGDKV